MNWNIFIYYNDYKLLKDGYVFIFASISAASNFRKDISKKL